MQELDSPIAGNESFEAKYTREVVHIATIEFELQSTMSKDLTQGCSVSTAIFAKAIEMKKYLLYSPRYWNGNAKSISKK